MRLNIALRTEREEFLRKLFASEPELSVRKAQQRLVDEFGGTFTVSKGKKTRKVHLKGVMRNAVILRIRAEARGLIPAEVLGKLRPPSSM